jgi:hypothetical protein
MTILINVTCYHMGYITIREENDRSSIQSEFENEAQGLHCPTSF